MLRTPVISLSDIHRTFQQTERVFVKRKDVDNLLIMAYIYQKNYEFNRKNFGKLMKNHPELQNDMLLFSFDVLSSQIFNVSSTKVILALCSIFHKEVKDKDLIGIIGSTQPAATMRELANLGFLFESKNSHHKRQSRNKEGKTYRKINGFNRAGYLPEWMEASKELKIAFIISCSGDYLTSLCDLKKLQIEHKMPIIARRKLGLSIYFPLTDKLILDGEAHKYFHVLMPSNNELKSRRCEACCEGKLIILPPGVNQAAYIHSWDEASELNKNKPPECHCEGCCYHDPRIIAYENNYTIANLNKQRNDESLKMGEHPKIIQIRKIWRTLKIRCSPIL